MQAPSTLVRQVARGPRTLAVGSLWLLCACPNAPEAAGLDSGAEGKGVAGFASPEACAACHPTHYSQWRVSNHAYALADPVFRAMNALGQQETQGALGDFCVECHAPIATRTEQTPVTLDDDGVHRQDLDALDEVARHGVSCDVCHTMTALGDVGTNAGFETTPDQTRRAQVRNPIPNAFHASEPASLFGTAEMCRPCHNVFSEFFREPVQLEATFREWRVSKFNGNQTCQECHMPRTEGSAAAGGPERVIHDHTMVGVDVSLLPPEEFPGYEQMRRATTKLLESAADWTSTWDADTRRLTFTIENHAGHALPSGATADREMWIELRVRDASGKVAFKSGTLDAQGDLRDDNPEHTLAPGTDPQLVVFRQRMRFDPSLEGQAGDPHGVHFLWEPNVVEERLVGAGGVLPVHYDLSMLDAGAYEVRARLRFRSFPPYLLRELVEGGRLDPDVPARVPTVEMLTLERTIRVSK